MSLDAIPGASVLRSITIGMACNLTFQLAIIAFFTVSGLRPTILAGEILLFAVLDVAIMKLQLWNYCNHLRRLREMNEFFDRIRET